MSTRSPRSRLMTVLLAVLLVTSLAAPAFAGSAVADDGGTYSLYCEPFEVGITDPMCETSVTSVTSDETIMHSMASSEAESMDAHYVMLDNHLEDTSTIASLEARHAIAQAWEDGKTESEAYQDALEAIRDYYAVHEENHIQQKAKATTQLGNVANASEVDDGVQDQWISSPTYPRMDRGAEAFLLSETRQTSSELVNGETINYTTPVIHYNSYYGGGDKRGDSSMAVNLAFDDDDYSDIEIDEGNRITVDSSNADGPEGWEIDIDPRFAPTFHTVNVGDVDDGGLPSETVFDGWAWRERWLEIRAQSDQAVANYDTEFVGALYDELDAGNIEPEDVRGAEGMARHLSGDSEVTDQRFQMALMQMSGMSNPDLAGTSTMTVEYEGYTDIRYNGTDSDTRVAELSGHTDATFEGLLFASNVPEGGFETNQTYAVGDINTTGTDLEAADGSVQIYDVTTGDTTHFYEGNFTITHMYDADGEQVETVEWDEPQYDTYDASEFAAYIQQVQELREEIDRLAGDDDEDGMSIGLPGSVDDFLDDLTNLEPHAIGLVLIAFALVAAVAASNRDQ